MDRSREERLGPRKFEPRRFGPRRFGPRRFGPRTFGTRHFGPRKLGARSLGRIVAAACASIPLLLAGCLLGPDYERPDVAVPESFREPTAVGTSIAELGWWELFEDEVLLGLIETSLRENPDIEPGLYAMIDIGAGTSEYSVVRMGPKGADDRVLCHEDRSTRRGGDDLAGAFSDNGARDELVAEFFRDVCRTWEAGRRKDAKSKQWKKYWSRTHAILTGGAARDEQLSHRLFANKPWDAKFPDFREFQWRPGWYEPPKNVLGTDLADEAQPNEDRSQFHLLAVAHGLSIERMNWPDWFPPGDVNPLPPTETHDPEWKPGMYE